MMTKNWLILILLAQCLVQGAAEAKLSPAHLDQAQKALDKSLYGSTLKLLRPDSESDYVAALMEAATVEAFDGASNAELYLHAAKLAPNKSASAMWRGYSLFLSRKYPAAKVELNLAVKLDANNALAHALLGRCLCFLDELDQGMAELKTALKLDPKSIQIYECMAEGYVGAGESKKAEPIFDKLVSLNPNSARFYIMRANFLDEAGKYAQALADYNRAVQLSPSSQYAHYMRARLLSQKQFYEKLIPDAQKGCSLENIEEFGKKSRHLLATAYDKTGQYKKAVEEYKQLVADTAHARTISGTQKICLFELTECYEKLHDYKNAKNTVDIIARIDPKSTEATKSRARIYSELGDYRNSLHDYNVLISNDPSSAEWYRERAKVFEKLGKPDSAKMDLKKAKELDDL